MDKYQEALEKLIYCANQTDCDFCKFVGGCVRPDKIALPLQELVCKATPKKPYFLNYGGFKFGNWKCPVCNEIVTLDTYSNYCKICGQKLDWSDESE